MKKVSCPACTDGAGELVERRVIDSGLEVVFECERCANVWSITF